MSETKFTPGPWFRKGKRVYWQKPDKDLPRGTLPNGLICTCKSAEDWPECNEEARANAALIAAAPELYDALVEATYQHCHTCTTFECARKKPIEFFIEHGCVSVTTICMCNRWWQLLRKVRDAK